MRPSRESVVLVWMAGASLFLCWFPMSPAVWIITGPAGLAAALLATRRLRRLPPEVHPDERDYLRTAQCLGGWTAVHYVFVLLLFTGHL